MSNIYNEETPFYSRKKVNFLLADIGIFIDFLVLEKKRPKCAALAVVGLPSWKKNKRNNPKNLIVSFMKLKSAKKGQDSFRVCSFYIHGKAHTERCASNKGKVEAWYQ